MLVVPKHDSLCLAQRLSFPPLDAKPNPPLPSGPFGILIGCASFSIGFSFSILDPFSILCKNTFPGFDAYEASNNSLPPSLDERCCEPPLSLPVRPLPLLPLPRFGVTDLECGGVRLDGVDPPDLPPPDVLVSLPVFCGPNSSSLLSSYLFCFSSRWRMACACLSARVNFFVSAFSSSDSSSSRGSKLRLASAPAGG